MAMFVVLFILMLIQNFIQKRMSSNKAILCHIVALLIAVIGIYFTYLDFQQYYAHRWLKEKFHLGGYLFWLAWICISLFFIGEKLKYREIDE